MNGSLNGNNTTVVSGISTSVLSNSTATPAGQVKAVTSGAGGRKYNQEQSKAHLLDTRADKIKDKVNTQEKPQDSGRKIDLVTVPMMHRSSFKCSIPV